MGITFVNQFNNFNTYSKRVKLLNLNFLLIFETKQMLSRLLKSSSNLRSSFQLAYTIRLGYFFIMSLIWPSTFVSTDLSWSYSHSPKVERHTDTSSCSVTLTTIAYQRATSRVAYSLDLYLPRPCMKLRFIQNNNRRPSYNQEANW